ncbi:ABC transporter permease/M1 family aminopeptidase [Arenicella xantha]|uniref:ABC-2 type transport system permease protein n=1 Tax=Arenicella xantha TaxID=644221 RepID=A0A395JI03_9GAMM|nr:M1 family aminopeptidase [Arenicella xantha]RBP49303.1 ABC-2 type transport system permease protein [Arenicella xantha]
MFIKMLAFEWRYFTRQPSFIVTCMVFFLLPFLAMVVPQVQIGAGGNVLFNSPYAIAQVLLILSIFSMFMVVNFVGNTAIRNDESKMAEIIYTKPISPLGYNLGRFFGAYLICVTVFAMVPLGTFFGTLMPSVDAERLGSNSLMFYLQPFLLFSLTTLFILAAIFYAVVQRFQSLMLAYVFALGLFILYSLAGQIFDEPHQRFMRAITDPFGLNAFRDLSRYWTPFERNTQLVGLTGVVLQNRLLWLAVGLLALLFGGRFFKPLGLTSNNKSSKLVAVKVDEAPVGASFAYRANQGSHFARFQSLTRFEMRQIFLSPAFILLAVFSSLQLIAGMVMASGPFGTDNWPLTKNLSEMIVGGFSLLTIIVVAYYTAEVVWRERSVGMGDIIDSTSAHNLVFWLSKFVAVCAVLIALHVFAIGIAVVFQLVAGYPHIDFAQYFITVFYFYLLPIFLLVVLAFFIQSLSPGKYIGILIFFAYAMTELVLPQLGVEHNMANFGSGPELIYSDLNGFGPFLQAHSWYMLYWSALAVVLAVVSYGLWRRGPVAPLKQRLGLLRYQIGNKGLSVIAIALLVFIGAGANIYYNTRVLNNFIGAEAFKDLQAEYERQFSPVRDDAVPMIQSVDADIAIYPSDRRIVARADIEVLNKSKSPITKFLVNLPRHSKTASVQIHGGEMLDVDSNFKTAWFEFSQPLQPGERRAGVLTSEIDHQGFKDRGEDFTVVENGTFINNGELFPMLGYQARSQLLDQHDRRKRGLDPVERAYKLEDSSRYTEHFIDPSVDFIDFSATISTSKDQVAMAPGYLEKQWEEGGRQYFRYVMDQPMMNFFSVTSGKLLTLKDEHNGVAIEVYHHPEHAWNLSNMVAATKDSLDYFQAAFGPYQHKQFRIIEFPGYRSFAQSFANTIPFSEEIGFTADLRDESKIDYVYYVTAHEMAHQWWGHQLGAANVQGAAILSETLSQYSALMVMQKKYGETKLRKFLTYELDRYLTGRTTELLEEMPLLRAERQQYIHYRKGSVVMMALRHKLGEQRINDALKRLLTEYKYQSNPYPTTLDLVRQLKVGASDSEISFIDNSFNQITVYDLRAEEVSVDELDGRYQINLTVNAQQFSADGTGVEAEQPFDEQVEVVLFDNDPNDFSAQTEVLYNQSHQLKTGENTIQLVVDALPKYIGVDPFVRFIDRDTGNNILKL